MAGWDVNEGRCCALNEDLEGEGRDGDDLVLGGGKSLRKWDGSEPDMYEYSLGCRLSDGTDGISLGGDIEV